MAHTYQIEIAVAEGISSTERGKVLEKFAERFLITQGFSVESEVRITATEVDLLCTAKSTGESVFVECKAYRSTISADVLKKLLGSISFGEYSAGWLISTFDLGKDAKGFEVEWNKKQSDIRKRLRIYPPQKLIQSLIDAHIIKSPDKLVLDKKYRASSDVTLLLTMFGEYWAVPVVDQGSGIHSAAFLFNAVNGELISDIQTIEKIKGTDTTLKLPWLLDEGVKSVDLAEKLNDELQSIVGVPVADNWADYRPARPQDFVGRTQTQDQVFGFFDQVRKGLTTTRLVALKGPSGWGKSSTVLKIAAKAGNKRNKSKIFVFTVDSRAASTSRFPELALITAVKAAIKQGFISDRSDLEFGNSSTLLSTESMQAVAEELRSGEKIICVFFDQFEELLYRQDLNDVFDEMRRMCGVVESAGTNIVIGFSWKTDGVIPTEHNAYHMWHTLADRRKEVDLPPFSEAEVTTAINRFANELGEPVIPQLRRLLQDHCQGFPWLLKKLCIHILEQSKAGTDQSDIIGSSMNIETLFKKDLENLSSIETGCLQEIARESPAEFFKIAQNYGDEVVSKLVEKRLVIRSGTKLTIYWDIFRDYILTSKIPYIPVTYTPKMNFNRYVQSLRFLSGKAEVNYEQLGSEMGIGEGATDNLVRDLVNIGHVEANRREHKIKVSFSNEVEAINTIFGFWKSHEFYRQLLLNVSTDGTLTDDEYSELFKSVNKRTGLDDKTLNTYSLITKVWLSGVDLIRSAPHGLRIMDPLISLQKSFGDLRFVSNKTKGGYFVGSAPPETVLSALLSILENSLTFNQAIDKHGRNPISALTQLGILGPTGVVDPNFTTQNARTNIAKLAAQTLTVSIVDQLRRNNTAIAGLEVGDALANQLKIDWSEGSKRRTGNALRQWAEWAEAN